MVASLGSRLHCSPWVAYLQQWLHCSPRVAYLPQCHPTRSPTWRL